MRSAILRSHAMQQFVTQIGITTLVVGVLVALATQASAVTQTFTDRATFEAQLGTTITDDYSNPGYDLNGPDEFDQFSDVGMSSVIGETDYVTTGSSNTNLILFQTTNPLYCAGCNGSFRLGFTTTSIGTANGVFGVGFEFANFPPLMEPLYTAFVTFGDTSSINFDLPLIPNDLGFFGITSDLAINSIHFGLPDGGPTQAGDFAIDNLTVPEPDAWLLGVTALLVVAALR